MLTGFYTAASGILQQERTIAVLTNNMTNQKTPGFRASRVVSTTFEQEYITRIEKGNTSVLGVASPIRVVEDVPVNFQTSSMEETGRPYDMAIDGPGFFLVNGTRNGAAQQYLTRNGNFDVDDEGYLILRGVGRVQTDDGDDIEVGDADFTVYADGTILDAGGGQLGTLAVVVVPEDARLQLNTNGAYTIDDMNNVTQLEDPKVAQGWLERSNVDMSREYTLVMEAQRAFQACSTALQIFDRLNQKAATQIASI